MSDTNFDGIIDPAASWADIPQLSTEALALGGLDGPMNAQAVAIAKRLKYLQANKANSTEVATINAQIASILAQALTLDGVKTFTSSPLVPDLPDTENSAKAASAKFVKTAIANLVASSPAALDTLNELAAALGNDPNFATTMTNLLAQKADSTTLTSRTKKGGLTQSIAENALTLTQAKRLFNFRSVTLTDGTAVEVTPPSDMTLTVPNGASLGLTSGVPGDILEILLYNGGTPVIGVVNAAGGLVLDESGLISSTAISASATSASVVYSSVAVTNSPYIILNRLSVTLPTAGAWSVLPTVIPTDLVGVGLLMKRVLYPAVATTSGTSIGFQIPSWAKKITLSIAGLSTNGTSNIIVKAGIAGVAQSTGYNSGAFQYSNSLSTSTTAFVLALTAAASVFGGAVEFLKQSDTTWCAKGAVSNAIANSTSISISGSVSLSGVLDSLFLTTVNGTDTFDAGSVSILVEG